MNEKECCLEDVRDLTGDLRNSDHDTWRIIRKLLIDSDINLDKLALAGFIESEDGLQFGLVVTEGRCYEFHREVGKSDSFVKWIEGEESLEVFIEYEGEVEWSREFIEQGKLLDI